VVGHRPRAQPATTRARQTRVPRLRQKNERPPTREKRVADQRQELRSLSKSLAHLSRAVGQTADLFDQLRLDLDAMRTLAGIHSAQLMTVAAELNPDRNGDEQQHDEGHG